MKISNWIPALWLQLGRNSVIWYESPPHIYLCGCTNLMFHQITKLMIGAMNASVSSTRTYTRPMLVANVSVMVSGTNMLKGTCSQSAAGVDSRFLDRDGVRGGGASVVGTNIMIIYWPIDCVFCDSVSLPGTGNIAMQYPLDNVQIAPSIVFPTIPVAYQRSTGTILISYSHRRIFI